MDISEESLKYAREYAEMLNVKGIKFVLGDVHNQLDFIENRQFDIVFMTGISGQSQAPVFWAQGCFIPEKKEVD